MDSPFNIVIVGQRGRLAHEAVLFAASLRAADPGFEGRLIVAEPQPGPLWSWDPRIQSDDLRECLGELGAEVVPFASRHFGESYPNGNKAEALAVLPEGVPFVFFDTDTLVTGRLSEVPFDFGRPSASMNRENTWPRPPLYGPGYEAIWRAVFATAGADFAGSEDDVYPPEHWRRYLYFNAGWFFGPCPVRFGERLTSAMVALREHPPPELAAQALYPWLDQIALPPVIHAMGGGRPGPELDGLDGDVTTHWRAMPLLYARAPDPVIRFVEEIAAPNRIKKVLKGHEPFLRFLYQGRGAKARALFDRNDLPRQEAQIRRRLKAEGLWMR